VNKSNDLLGADEHHDQTFLKTDSAKMTYGNSSSRYENTPNGGVKSFLPIPVILFLLAFIVPIHFFIGPLRLTGLRIILLILIVPMIINLIKGKYGKILFVDYVFFLHFLWVAFAILVNDPRQFLQSIGATGIDFIGGYMIGRAYIRNIISFQKLAATLVLIAFCTLPFAIYEAYTGHAIIVETIRNLPGITSVNPLTDAWYHRVRLGLYRTQVFAAHPIHYGFFAASIFSLSYIALRNFYSTKLRLLLSFSVGMCVFFSLSSGPLLGMTVQLGLISWAFVFQKLSRPWLMLTGVIIAVYIFVDILSERPPILVFLAYASLSPSTAYGRYMIFEWGMKNVWSSPIIGIGSADWERAWFMSGSMDNFWLLIMMRYGVPAFLFLVSGWFWALWKVGQRNFNSDSTLCSLRRAWVISSISVSFILASVHVWDAMYSFVFFLFGAGIWLMTVEPQYGQCDLNSDLERKPILPYTRFPKRSIS